MTRVRYLAGLAGATERQLAPLLRPPRRLFPHEPLPVEPSPLSQPANELGGDPQAAEPPVVGPEPLAPAEQARREPVRSEPEVAPPVRARSLDLATALPEPAPIASRTASHVEPRRRDAETVSKARTVGRAADAVPPARRETRSGEPKPVTRDREPVRAEVARRSTTALELPHLRSRTAPPPERASATTTRTARAAARGAGVHIGTIDVTVAPPPAAPSEPALAALPAPVPRGPAAFAPRGASTTRWFGLAQR